MFADSSFTNRYSLKAVYLFYFSYFDSVEICKYRSDWMEARITGFLPNHTPPENYKVTNIEVFQHTEVELGLFQEGQRYLLFLKAILQLQR